MNLKSFNLLGSLHRVGKLVASIGVGVGILALSQDIFVFPGAASATFLSGLLKDKDTPPGVESFWFYPDEQTKLEIWHSRTKTFKQTALILHGNGGTLYTYHPLQEWLNSQGISSYLFSYRGFGLSNGWPSESLIYKDAEGILELIAKRENISPESVLIVGVSLGSAPAAYLSQKYHSKALLLFAPISSLPNVVNEKPFLQFFSPLLRDSFSTELYVGNLQNTCLALIHGTKDSSVAPHHSTRLKEAYRGAGKVIFERVPEGTHLNIFRTAFPFAERALKKCL